MLALILVFILVVVLFGLGFVAKALFWGGVGAVYPVGARFPGRSPEIQALVLVGGAPLAFVGQKATA